MVFTTQIFLFFFFPACILSYHFICALENYSRKSREFFRKFRIKDLVLLAFSFLFYSWAYSMDLVRIILYILVVYGLAKWIENSRRNNFFIRLESEDENDNDRKYKRIYTAIFPFVFAITILVFYLIYFKYSHFIEQILSVLFNNAVAGNSVIAPLGISFITFSAISYLADIYRGGGIIAKGSLLDCALYLSFFPKVVSGPIVPWKDFQKQLPLHKASLEFYVSGINRIMIGFAKKVLLADTFGACLADIRLSNIDPITAAGTLVLYMLQIYYDFAGYSDIAIGLSRLFGFEFKENFNFPYLSKSISEFWRRWHISLGSWFREYIYFPLGGSRGTLRNTLRNLLVIFFLTGIWHGAGWNYILWGSIHGILVVIERIIQNRKFYKQMPIFIKYIGTMLSVMLLWQCFRYQSLREVMKLFGIILGIVQFDKIYYTWPHYFDMRLIAFTIIGIIGATIMGTKAVHNFGEKLSTIKAGYFLQEMTYLLLFVSAILFMVNSTYSPFIYFQY